jgi:aryl-alcohol dehydrogenase-like predicted oxidoreductase
MTPRPAVTALPVRPLGNTGLSVPIVSLGLARLGHPAVPLEAAADLLELAYEGGIRLVDVAPHYGDAELKLKPFLRRRRADVIVTSKVLVDQPERGDAGLQIEETLRRTGAGYLDVVYAHSVGDVAFDRLFEAGGALSQLEAARRRQYVRAIGITAHNHVPHVARVLAARGFDAVMLPVNPVDRQHYDFEHRVVPLALEGGAAVLAMKVIGGALPHVGPESSGLLGAEADRAIRYALGVPGIATAVVGCSGASQIRSTVETARSYRKLTDEETAALLQRGRQLAERIGPRWGPAS